MENEKSMVKRKRRILCKSGLDQPDISSRCINIGFINTILVFRSLRPNGSNGVAKGLYY